MRQEEQVPEPWTVTSNNPEAGVMQESGTKVCGDAGTKTAVRYRPSIREEGDMKSKEEVRA
jgi:hypothetical protein